MIHEEHLLPTHPESGEVAVLFGEPLEKRKRITSEPYQIQRKWVVPGAWRRINQSRSSHVLLRSGFRSRRVAAPVRCIFQVAGSLVFCILWIGAQGTCETLRSRSQHLIRSNALFDPFLYRADGVERVDARTTAAMAHSGNHEKTHPVALILAHLVEDGVVVPNRRFGSDPSVGPSMSQ